MGLLDKAKQLAAQAEAGVNKASGDFQSNQQKKNADAWLRQLGQWVYAERMGRDPRAAAEIDVLVGQLRQFEEQHELTLDTPIPAPGVTTATDPSPFPAPTPQPEPVPMPDPSPIPSPDPTPSPMPQPSTAAGSEPPSGPPPGMASPPGS